MINRNYITIQGWQIDKLNLKGNELILFALIYGFSQNDNSEYKGSLTYISKGLKLSRRSVIRLLNSLIEKNLIIKIENNAGNSFKYNKETIDAILSGDKSSPVTEVHQSSDKSTPIGSDKSIPNNNTNTNTINYEGLINFLNKKTGRNFRVFTDKVKKSYVARLKEGYTKENILQAIVNATQIQSHKDNGCQYLTLEFFSRSSTLDKYGYETAESKKLTEEKVEFKEARKEEKHFNF